MKFTKLLLIITALVAALLLSLFVRDFYFGGAGKPTSDETGDAMLQYEWPQIQGDASFTRFSAGPAPETSNILWKANIMGVQSYICAFNGMIFATTKTAVFALDYATGNIIWNTTVPAPGPWPMVYKIDDTHLVVGNSSLDIETGQILWTSPEFSASSEPLFTLNVYSPEEKMFFVKGDSCVQGWDFSNPSNPPKLAWTTYVSGGGVLGSGVQYGDGKVFPGSFETHQMALDAKTGEVLWDTETKASMLFSGAYYQGKFIRAGSHDNTLYCFNATDGAILWAFNPHTEDGYFCVGSAVAYDIVYALNKDGYLYALDVNTGDIVWKYQGPGALMFPGTPTVADGKVYATTGQIASYTGKQGASEFACLDAYTGNVSWTLQIEAFAPRESVVVAYGNLYLIPGTVTTAVDSISGEEYDTMGQVWAIGAKPLPSNTEPWAMWRQNPAHTGVGQTGPTKLALVWKFATTGAVVSSPSTADGRVYVGSEDKNIYCLDARSGGLIWKFAADGRIKSSPAVADGKVYIGPDDGYVYCLNAYDGSLIWKKSAGGFVQAHFASLVTLRSSPAVVNGRVYVGSLDTNVYCLNADNGGVIWTHKTEGYITSSPAIVDGSIYVVSQEPDLGALYKLDAATGNLVWKRTLPSYSPLGGGIDMHASPSVGDGMVFAASNIEAYYGVNAATGDVEWTYRDEAAKEFIVCSPVYNDGKVFLIDKFSIVCVNSKNGDLVWSSYLNEELYVSPSYADGKLYVVTDQRSIFVLDAANGEALDRFVTGSNGWSAPTLYGGRLYVGNNDWNVYCLADPIA